MTSADRITVHRQTRARFTASEFMELVQLPPIANWPGKVELVDGEIVRMSPAHVPHWNAQRIAFLRLQSAFAPLGADWVVGQEPTVRLAGDTIREPDVAVLRNPDFSGKLFDRTSLYLAIEIADSSLAIDLGEKRYDYAEAWVPHYWVVDLNGRNVRVMRDPHAGDYDCSTSIPFGSPIPLAELDLSIILD